MRFLLAFLVLASGFAAEVGFITGQGARLVIGQETFTESSPGDVIMIDADDDGEEDDVGFLPNQFVLGGAGGVAYVNDTLFVADSNRLGAGPQNHRVLIYFNVSQKFPGETDILDQTTKCPVCVGGADVVLGQNNFEEAELRLPGANTLRLPLGVASNGVRLAVADSDNNRVMIWNSIPTVNGQPADLVLGQSAFDTNTSNGFNPTATSLRGPQDVLWDADGNLWVADTGNNRVLRYTNPHQNGQSADLVLGAPDFTTFVQSDLAEQDADAAANRLLTPTSISSDGIRFFIADLGYNRVLIFNSIPNTNGAPADVVVGQTTLLRRSPNASSEVCDEIEQEVVEGEEEPDPIYPPRCAATLSFPRDVLSDGQRLFVVDGGNDRILIFDNIPTTNAAHADRVIGQVDEFAENTSDSAFPGDVASPGVMRTPTSIAWDGRNLYVADPFNRRVLAFTESEQRLARTGVRNAASFEIFASGRVFLSGSTTTVVDTETGEEAESAVGDEILIRLQDDEDREYTYTVKSGDTLNDITIALTNAVNDSNDGAGDPDVVATANAPFWTIILTSRVAGPVGNDITYAAEINYDEGDTDEEKEADPGPTIFVDVESPTLDGGADATEIAPYTLVSVVGSELSDVTLSADLSQETLPTELGGARVYFDGIEAPLLYVSPGQINAQVPIEFADREGSSAYVRTEHTDGRVVASNAIPVPIRLYNPGLFGMGGTDPRPGVAFHSSSHAVGVVSVDGRAVAENVVSVSIEGRVYEYEVTEEDENTVLCDLPDGCTEEDDEDCARPDICSERTAAGLRVVMNRMVELINADPMVEASASTQFTRILLRARVQGPAGVGIRYSTAVSDSANIVLTATTPELCCANEAGALVTDRNPAVAGEIISFWATGLGIIEPEEAADTQITGAKYRGPAANTPAEFVSSLIGGRTANVLNCSLEVGSFGLYRCDLQLNLGLPTNNLTTATIAQGFNVSNVVTIPVYSKTSEP